MKSIENYIYQSGIVREHLVDDESKQLYDARVRLSWGGSKYDFSHLVCSIYGDFIIPEIDSLDIVRRNDMKGIIIYGAGLEGRYAYEVLIKSKYGKAVSAFCDASRKKQGTTYCNLPVMSPEQLEHDEYMRFLIVVAVANNTAEVYRQLLNRKINREYLFCPRAGRLLGTVGVQYFDYLRPMKREVFIDCGSFNMSSSVDFIKWCEGDYERIIALEPDSINYQRCITVINQNRIDRAEVIDAGVWKEDGVLNFSGSGLTSSRVQEEGGTKVRVRSIDSILNGERATYIKMDIEGSEYEALLGAKKTIRQYQPRMAISLYHNPHDIFTLPALVLELNQNYQLAIRHYETNEWETVLYAF